MSTQIEWAANPDGTPGVVWNPVTGCTKVHAGCTHCYAKRIHDMRHKAHLAGKTVAECYHTPFEHVKTWDNRLTAPLHWRGERTCFLDSMGDPFHDDIPFEFIDKIMAIVALTPHVRYVALTKRVDIALKYLTDATVRRNIYDTVQRISYSVDTPWSHKLRHDFYYLQDEMPWPLPNLILGTSPCNQKTADETIPILLKCPAATRCVSLEPLLGPIQLWPPFLHFEAGINWVITGGESGPGARPSHPDWFRQLRDQCTAAGVPFFFKQGSAANWPKFKDFDSFPDDLQIRQRPDVFNAKA